MSENPETATHENLFTGCMVYVVKIVLYFIIYIIYTLCIKNFISIQNIFTPEFILSCETSTHEHDQSFVCMFKVWINKQDGVSL